MASADRAFSRIHCGCGRTGGRIPGLTDCSDSTPQWHGSWPPRRISWSAAALLQEPHPHTITITGRATSTLPCIQHYWQRARWRSSRESLTWQCFQRDGVCDAEAAACGNADVWAAGAEISAEHTALEAAGGDPCRQPWVGTDRWYPAGDAKASCRPQPVLAQSRGGGGAFAAAS